MTLDEGIIGRPYTVERADLPTGIDKRMEALGMTRGTLVTLLRKKRSGTAVMELRGTRFAVGRDITTKITVKEAR
ncbi:FeoA domain-containing protein [Neobittarella massiliensis]|uniref:FeoA domain n=1 Tax=uncultured Anaerotruncus sp. TaxID=905011 RepID=A0A1C6KC87_9FIRM|nr:FeoA domain-containing protein [Neobittarella massiliensis]SCJ91861.1 FeoA domain [uncultured Anaerotruncus sp.]